MRLSSMAWANGRLQYVGHWFHDDYTRACMRRLVEFLGENSQLPVDGRDNGDRLASELLSYVRPDMEDACVRRISGYADAHVEHRVCQIAWKRSGRWGAPTVWALKEGEAPYLEDSWEKVATDDFRVVGEWGGQQERDAAVKAARSHGYNYQQIWRLP